MTVLDRLQRYSPNPWTDEDREYLERQVLLLQELGWSDDRVFRYLRNTEEVSPEMPEAVALSNMRQVRMEKP